MAIKTFRGLLTDDAVDTIVLHTNNGSMGYRIVKFEIIASNPGTKDMEAYVTISKVDFTPATTINLSDNTILGVAYWHQAANLAYPDADHKIVFDKEVFNQDIYIGCNDVQDNDGMNYYIELEQVKLDTNANTVATLKDMRNTATPLP
jgi:hypothetical protein